MPSETKGRILHVDDDEIVRYTVRRILTGAGYEVMEAANGAEGLRLASLERPDLVLLDVKLPDMSGFEACSRIKADPDMASIPVVHLSSVHVLSDDRARGLEGGADGYLTQPVDARELRASIEAHLRVRDSERALRESEQFARSTLDAIPGNLCVLDERGSIIFVNAAWNRFAQENGVAPQSVGIGRNYLEVCRHAAGPSAEAASDFAARLVAVLEGTLDEFEMEYPCHSPDRKRWFTGRATRFAGEGAVRALILHTDITQRKQAEERLREQHIELEHIYATVPAGMALVDRDLKFVRINDRLAEINRRSPADHLGRTVREVIPALADLVEPVYQSVLETGRPRLEIEVHGNTPGTASFRRDWLTSYFPLRGESGTVSGVGIFVVDITDLKRTQDELRAANERLRVLIDSSPLAILGVDAAGRVLNWSTGAAQMFGWPESEAVGRVCPTVSAENLDDYLAMLNRVMRGDRVEGWVRRRTKKDGSRINARLNAAPLRDATGKTEGAIVLIEDITSQYQTEEKLRESEKRFRRIAENAPDIIYRFRISPTPGFEFVSRAVTEITGYTPEEHYADPGLGLRVIHSDDRPALRAFIAGSTIEGTHTRRWVRKDGATIWIEDRHIPIRDEKGKVVAIEGVARDVTQQRQAEQAVRAANERRRLLSKRLLEVHEAERAALARELHDEIGQSLTALKLSLSHLARGRRGGKSARELDAAVAMTDTVLEQVRSLSLGLRPPQLELMGLEAALVWHVQSIANKSGLEVHFEAKLLPRGRNPQIDIACFRIVQEALTNVLRHAEAESVTVNVEQSAEELSVLVRDDGKGFDVQESVRSSLLGASMGLLNMEERANLLGGSLQIESREGAGTAVHARLPLGPQPAPASTTWGTRT